MIKVLSYGGGLDSFAMLLDAIERGEKPDACVFIDVGDGTATREGEDPAEWPGTYRHMREIVIPLCEREGIAFEWLDSERYPVRDARSLLRVARSPQADSGGRSESHLHDDREGRAVRALAHGDIRRRACRGVDRLRGG